MPSKSAGDEVADIHTAYFQCSHGKTFATMDDAEEHQDDARCSFIDTVRVYVEKGVIE